MTLLDTVLLAALAGDLPRQVGDPIQEDAGYKLLDLDRLEGSARLGFLFFSKDFEADPELAGGVQLRAPVPLLSRGLFGMEADDIGAFLEVTVSSIDRDPSVPLKDAEGTLFFIAGGLDWTFYRDPTFLAAAQLGLQFGSFGGVSDTDDGVALLLGAVGGLQVSEGIRVTLTPQAGVADAGDYIFFLHLGIQISF